MSASSPSTPYVRAYKPTWDKLRKDKVVVLHIANPMFLQRIKRMISKEKNTDPGFRLLNEVEFCRLVFEYDAKKQELTVRLTSRLGIVEIVG